MKQTSEKLVPITRLGMFFGGEDYDLDVGMGQEWLEGDMNFTIVLYRIDRYKTKKDNVYGEVVEDGVQFMAPVEIKGLVQVMAPTNKFYGNSRHLMIWGLKYGWVIILVIMKVKTELDIMLSVMTDMLSQIINTLTVVTNRSTERLQQHG